MINVKASSARCARSTCARSRSSSREAQPWTMMSSYNKLNGTYTSENRALLTGVAARTTGASRPGDDRLVRRPRRGGADERRATTCSSRARRRSGRRSSRPSRAAQLKMDVLDRNVERVLDLVLKSPTFKKAARTGQAGPCGPRQGGDARRQPQGMVLLKNNGALPLASSAKTLALFGNTSYAMITGGTGSGDVNEAYTVSMRRRPEGRRASRSTRRWQPPTTRTSPSRSKKRPPTQAFMPPAPLAEMTVARCRDRPPRDARRNWASSRSAGTRASSATARARATSS